MVESFPKQVENTGKRRNCSLQAISLFPTVFFKRLVSQGRQKVSLCGNGLNLSQMSPGFNVSVVQVFLALSQTTNFKLFQIERVCRWHFKFDEYGGKFSKLVENTVRKGEIAHYEQFLLFPQCFQMTYTADTWKPGLVWERVKTLWQKEELLLTNSFSFSLSVFYLFGELSATWICHLPTLSVWKTLKFVVWEGLSENI